MRDAHARREDATRSERRYVAARGEAVRKQQMMPDARAGGACVQNMPGRQLRRMRCVSAA